MALDRVTQQGMTITELGVYKRCRKMWDYQYAQNLVPTREAPYFTLGRIVHRILENWTNNPTADVEVLWVNEIDVEQKAWKQRYLENVGVRPSPSEIEAFTEETALLSHDMVAGYAEYYKKPLPEGFEILDTEITLQTFVNGVLIQGTLDGLLLDHKTGKLWVLERKTFSNHPKREVLDSNDQFVGYSYLVKKVFHDRPFGGVFYDGLWKRNMEDSRGKVRPLATRYMREYLLKTDVETDNWEQALIAMLQENSGSIYPNRIWQGCYDCDYERLCAAETKGYNDEAIDIRNLNYKQREFASWLTDTEAE